MMAAVLIWNISASCLFSGRSWRRVVFLYLRVNPGSRASAHRRPTCSPTPGKFLFLHHLEWTTKLNVLGGKSYESSSSHLLLAPQKLLICAWSLIPLTLRNQRTTAHLWVEVTAGPPSSEALITLTELIKSSQLTNWVTGHTLQDTHRLIPVSVLAEFSHVFLFDTIFTPLFFLFLHICCSFFGSLSSWVQLQWPNSLVKHLTL